MPLRDKSYYTITLLWDKGRTVCTECLYVYVDVYKCRQKRGINAFHLIYGNNINTPKHLILSLAILSDMKTHTGLAHFKIFSDVLIRDAQVHQAQKQLSSLEVYMFSC